MLLPREDVPLEGGDLLPQPELKDWPGLQGAEGRPRPAATGHAAPELCPAAALRPGGGPAAPPHLDDTQPLSGKGAADPTACLQSLVTPRC